MASPGETRYTDPITGGMKGQKEDRFGGADPLAMIELAKVYGMGEQKYDRFNYLKGYPWSLSVDALFRHLFAFLSGEDVDPESGLLHTAHVSWHANTLTSFQLRGIGTDDRAPNPWHDDREPTCCDYACYEDPDCRCDECVLEAAENEELRGPRCDHNTLLDDHCELCCSMCIDEGR
jgi:hypothetical protein